MTKNTEFVTGYGVSLKESYYNLGSCCGSSYVKTVTDKTDMSKNHYGIKLAHGLIGKEYTGPKISVHHVNTKNGPLTVSIRRVF